MQKIKDVAIKMLRSTYGVYVEDKDMYVMMGRVFLSTAKTAEVFNTSYHNFSNVYAKHFMDAGAVRLVIGRNKYYSMDKVVSVLSASLENGVSVLEQCRKIKKVNRKIKRQKGKK